MWIKAFQGQTTTSTAVTMPHPPNMRPRVRARRGQATDPHSIAERLRRERIAERMRALQDLVPSCNKTDYPWEEMRSEFQNLGGDMQVINLEREPSTEAFRLYLMRQDFGPEHSKKEVLQVIWESLFLNREAELQSLKEASVLQLKHPVLRRSNSSSSSQDLSIIGDTIWSNAKTVKSRPGSSQGVDTKIEAAAQVKDHSKDIVLMAPSPAEDFQEEKVVILDPSSIQGAHNSAQMVMNDDKLTPDNQLLSTKSDNNSWKMAIEGSEFRNKTSDELMEMIPRIQVMARSLPSDKHMLVTNLRSVHKEVVAVTGDGSNDAPALHEADIGLAMGIAGTEVAKETADVIILDDNFSTIVNVAKWGRAVYINIQKFVQFQLTVNIVALMINFVSACISGSAPLTAVQLLWVNLIMDTLGALALATEPPHDGLMNRPPIGRGVGFITKAMWRNIAGQSIYQMAVLFVFNFAGKQILGIHGSDATDIINTFIFNTFVFCQVFNEINSRDIEQINIFRGMFSNWIFIGVMVSTVVFQVIIVEFLGTFASTVPLSWQLWLLSIVIGFASMPVAVILKCIPVERKNREHHDGYDQLPSGPEDV